jgi:hypothetical protein
LKKDIGYLFDERFEAFSFASLHDWQISASKLSYQGTQWQCLQIN